VRRQSGLLIPEVGYSSSEGFLMKNSFFWAISDYQDMTFYSITARHRLGTGAEYRYVNSRDSDGKVITTILTPSGRTGSWHPEGRWEFKFQHHEEIAEDLYPCRHQLVATLIAFDLEKALELTSRPYLDSNIFYVERWRPRHSIS
jgi:LPS-assembly protein